MKIRNKLIVGFTAIILFSGVMGFSAVDGILRTSQLTNELFECPLMSSNFARSAQTAFVRIRVAGDDARHSMPLSDSRTSYSARCLARSAIRNTSIMLRTSANPASIFWITSRRFLPPSSRLKAT